MNKAEVETIKYIIQEYCPPNDLLVKAALKSLADYAISVAQQPQAEPFGYVSQHTNGLWEFSPTTAGVYPDTAKSITAVYAKQAQAEAVPPGYVLVPVEPTDKMAQAAHHFDLSYMPGQEGADRAAIYRAMVNAAIAQQKDKT